MTFNIKVARHLRVPVFGLTNQQRFTLAQMQIAAIRERTAKGLDVNDQAARPLSAPYARRKARRGLPAVPDLRLTGNLMKSLQVQQISGTEIKIGFSGGVNALKAAVNHARRNQLGVSRNEQQMLHEEGSRMLKENWRAAIRAIAA